MHYDGWSSFKRLTACAPPLVAKSGRPMRLALTPEVSSATAASSWSSAADYRLEVADRPAHTATMPAVLRWAGLDTCSARC